MKISVTAEDIAQKVPEGVFRCANCPVARAITRALGVNEPLVVLVGGVHAVLHDDRHGRTIWQTSLPEAVSAFIYAFDAGAPVQPFDFDLEVPDA